MVVARARRAGRATPAERPLRPGEETCQGSHERSVLEHLAGVTTRSSELFATIQRAFERRGSWFIWGERPIAPNSRPALILQGWLLGGIVGACAVQPRVAKERVGTLDARKNMTHERRSSCSVWVARLRKARPAGYGVEGGPRRDGREARIRRGKEPRTRAPVLGDAGFRQARGKPPLATLRFPEWMRTAAKC
jgi:hypothetical protein